MKTLVVMFIKQQCAVVGQLGKNKPLLTNILKTITNKVKKICRFLIICKIQNLSTVFIFTLIAILKSRPEIIQIIA